MYESEGIRNVEIHRKVKSYDSSDNIEPASNDDTLGEQLLRADSDQVSLDSLLKAVMNISDRLNEQEEKLKVHEDSSSNTNSVRKTAVQKYSKDDSFSSDSDVEQSQTSKLSSAHSTKLRSGKNVPSSPAGEFSEGRKNVSFSSNSVRDIDMENQRLLKEILNTKPKTLSRRKKDIARPPSASAINRLRKQKEIERENLRILNRLQSVKPTKTLSRNNLLTDHMKNTDRVGRISKCSKGRPVSAPANRSSVNQARHLQTFDNKSVASGSSIASPLGSQSRNMKSFDNQSIASGSPSTSSIRSIQSASGTRRKVRMRNVWEPGW